MTAALPRLRYLRRDIRWGDGHDLARRRVQRVVRGWGNNGLVAAFWAGAPCHSWGRAWDIRRGLSPLRSDQRVMGLPGLAPCDAEKVRMGNSSMQFSASLFLLRRSSGVPVAIEHLSVSRIWLAPQFTGLLQKCPTVVFDSCRVGQSCRERTRVVYANVDLQPSRTCAPGREEFARRPVGRAISNRERIQRASSGRCRPKPTRPIVLCFQFALAEKQARKLLNVWCG